MGAGPFVRGSLVSLLSLLVACAHAPPAAPLSRDVEQELLLDLSEGGRAPDDVLILLALRMQTAGRLREAHEHFASLRTKDPKRPLIEALEAFFQVLRADEVFLLRRVAYVEDALAKLDRAAKADGRAPRLFRALVLAELPEQFNRRDEARRELELLSSSTAALPRGLLRGVYEGLAKVHAAGGDAEAAAKARQRARAPSRAFAATTEWSHGAKEGTRFSPPEMVEEAPGVFALYGHDFAEVYFVVTATSVVAIDSGTTPGRAARMKALLRTKTSLPLSHVIITHAHWDHVGGLSALVEPGTQVLAHAHFQRTLDDVNHPRGELIPRFLGTEAPSRYELAPSRTVEKPELLEVGGRTFRILPAASGETEGALFVELPREKLLFAGDALWPQLGVPFISEGSADGFISALEQVIALGPERILHGHRPLGPVLMPSALPAIRDAFVELRVRAQKLVERGGSLSGLLFDRFLPTAIREHPAAMLAYLNGREAFLRRLHDEATGYWDADGSGMEVLEPAALAAAVDLLGGGRPAAFVETTEALLARGDLTLAHQVADWGVKAHPKEQALTALRDRAKLLLLQRWQQLDANRFPVYADALGLELGEAPAPADRAEEAASVSDVPKAR